MNYAKNCWLFAAAALFLLPLASASCAPFLQVTADESRAVAQGQTASFTVAVLNNGPNPETINANSLCDSSKLDCQFPDFSGPRTLASGASTTFHLNANARNGTGNYTITLQVFGGTTPGACLEERSLRLGVVAAQATAKPSPGAPISASISPTENTASQPGETIEYTVLVQNNKPETQFVELKFGTDEGNVFADSSRADAEQFRLETGEARTVSLKTTIPPGTPGGVYSFTLRVRGSSTAGTAHDVTLPAKIFVFSPTLSMQWASTPASCLQAFHYGQATHFLSLRNLGEVTGPFEAELVVPAALQPFAKLSKTSFELKQREATTLALSVNASPPVPAGEYSYSVKLRYLNSVALRFDSCVSVKGVVGIEAIGSTQHEIERGGSQNIVLRVANNGSLASNYSIEYDPLPLRGVELSVNKPKTFLLEAGASRLVNLLLDANLSAPLGAHAIPLALRTTNQSLALTLLLTVVSSNKTGQSPLEIAGTQFKALEGIPTQQPVLVRNKGFQDLDKVELVVDGMPAGWVTVDSAPQAIGLSAEREFLVTFKIPVGANKARPVQLYAFTLHAVSGLEGVNAPAFVEVTLPVRKMSFQLESLREEAVAGGASKLLLRLAVYNEGNVPLTGVRPSLPYSGEYTVGQDQQLSLAPGAQEYVTLEIGAPAGAREQDVFLRFESAEGAEKTQSVRLPAIGGGDGGALGRGVDLGWKAVAIVVLLVAIMAVLAKEEIEDFFAK